MHELHQKVEILDYLETYIFNSGKGKLCLSSLSARIAGRFGWATMGTSGRRMAYQRPRGVVAEYVTRAQ